LLAKNLVNGKRLSRKKVAKLIARPHPWRAENLVDDRAAARIILRNRFDGWEAAWLERDADYFVEKFIHNPIRGAAQRFIAGLGKNTQYVSRISKKSLTNTNNKELYIRHTQNITDSAYQKT
jgi:hypothetical protein